MQQPAQKLQEVREAEQAAHHDARQLRRTVEALPCRVARCSAHRPAPFTASMYRAPCRGQQQQHITAQHSIWLIDTLVQQGTHCSAHE